MRGQPANHGAQIEKCTNRHFRPMVAERGRKSPLRCPRHCTTLLLSCLAGGAGDSWHQEVCHYIPPQVVAQHSKWKVRYIHSIEINTDEHVGKLQWARSDVAVRASLLVRKKKEKGKKGRSREKKQLVVIVPAKWKLLRRVERLRDQADKEAICDLIANWISRRP